MLVCNNSLFSEILAYSFYYYKIKQIFSNDIFLCSFNCYKFYYTSFLLTSIILSIVLFPIQKRFV